jgi:DNA-binding transcriptional regulator PaaX
VISKTQLEYLKKLAAEPGPVPAQTMFDTMRISKLSLSRMVEAGVVQKQIIDGRSHYRLTARGVRALAQAAEAA